MIQDARYKILHTDADSEQWQTDNGYCEMERPALKRLRASAKRRTVKQQRQFHAAAVCAKWFAPNHFTQRVGNQSQTERHTNS